MNPPPESPTPPADSAITAEPAAQVLAHTFRRHYGRLVAILTRQFGADRLGLVEDVVQDALLRAAQVWPYHGVPPQPLAWLLTTARHRAIDRCRRDQRWRTQEAAVVTHLDQLRDHLAAAPTAVFNDEIQDATLRMMFVCCHPGLAGSSQVALILKTLAGFGEREIAAAFLLPRNTIAKRLVRARRFLRDAQPPLELPPPDELTSRTAAVLHALYLLFNEGYCASGGDQTIRADLCAEAHRLLAALQASPVGQTPAASALAALMCFHRARLAARVDLDGNTLLLVEQDRSTWDRRLIQTGFAHLQRSGRGEELTRYHCEAGIAACHCLAPTYAATDWARIIALYEKLHRIAPSPLATLNHAVALFEHGQSDAARQLLDHRIDPTTLDGHHRFHAVRAHLLQDHDRAAARAACQRAIELAPLPAERRILAARLASLSPR